MARSCESARRSVVSRGPGRRRSIRSWIISRALAIRRHVPEVSTRKAAKSSPTSMALRCIQTTTTSPPTSVVLLEPPASSPTTTKPRRRSCGRPPPNGETTAAIRVAPRKCWRTTTSHHGISLPGPNGPTSIGTSSPPDVDIGILRGRSTPSSGSGRTATPTISPCDGSSHSAMELASLRSNVQRFSAPWLNERHTTLRSCIDEVRRATPPTSGWSTKGTPMCGSGLRSRGPKPRAMACAHGRGGLSGRRQPAHDGILQVPVEGAQISCHLTASRNCARRQQIASRGTGR